MSDASSAEGEQDLEALAAMTFEPWSHEPGEWTPPTNLEWAQLANPHLVSVRLAWLTLHKTKKDLGALHAELGEEGFDQLMGQLCRSADWFKGFYDMIVSAECRIMCAAAAAETDCTAQ